jgi:hypothetical protein
MAIPSNVYILVPRHKSGDEMSPGEVKSFLSLSDDEKITARGDWSMAGKDECKGAHPMLITTKCACFEM